MTERIYSTDSYARAMEATVLDADSDDRRLPLDRTVFYPGGGGQPPDTGLLRVGDDALVVERVTQDSSGVWHWVSGGLPGRGTAVHGEVDWDRRYLLMRTHTAMHTLCGVRVGEVPEPRHRRQHEAGRGAPRFRVAGLGS